MTIAQSNAYAQPRPVALTAVNGNPGSQQRQVQTRPETRSPRVAILDNFQEPYLDVDNDRIKDLSHGQVVERYLLSQLPDAEVVRFQTFPRPDSTTEPGELVLNALDNIQKRIDDGDKIDAINISHGVMGIVQHFRDLTGIRGLTMDNLGQHRQAIREAMVQSDSTFYQNADKILQRLESLSEQGVKIYIAAGNDPTGINIMSLARGENIHVVGATHRNGEKTAFSSDNPFVTTWHRGIYPLRPVMEGGRAGYDFTGDGKADAWVDKDNLSGGQEQFKKNFTRDISLDRVMGTSYSAPMLLGETLKQQQPFNVAEVKD